MRIELHRDVTWRTVPAAFVDYELSVRRVADSVPHEIQIEDRPFLSIGRDTDIQ